MTRHLDWEGCFNARDLGGLRTLDGRITRRGALVRSDALEGLTEAGWAALWQHGVRTIVDPRDADEYGRDAAPRPAGVTTVRIPLDGVEDREFWDVWQSGPQFGTPVYYLPHIERFPDRSAAILRAIAHAAPGGVLFHCAGGRDRAGQIAMLALALAGVAPDEIAADYALSGERLRPLYAARGEPDQGPRLEAYLSARGTTAAEVIRTTLAAFDVTTLVDRHTTRALRARLLGEAASTSGPDGAEG